MVRSQGRRQISRDQIQIGFTFQSRRKSHDGMGNSSRGKEHSQQSRWESKSSRTRVQPRGDIIELLDRLGGGSSKGAEQQSIAGSSLEPSND